MCAFCQANCGYLNSCKVVMSRKSSTYLFLLLLLIPLLLSSAVLQLLLHTSSSHIMSSSSASSPAATAVTREHITLIGDSILDNKAYVRRQLPSVSQLLRKKVNDLNPPWDVSLCAIDGDVIDGIPRQLRTVPNDTTVLVLSIGGNDGLRYLGRLDSMGMNPLNFMRLMPELYQEFSTQYAQMLDRVVSLEKKVIVCTIYYPCFTQWLQQKVSCAGLYFMNRIITAEAAKRGLPVIDLASVFNREEDYANPIEPGVMGADKITTNIIHIVQNHQWNETRHAVYADRTYSIASPDELRSDAWRKEPRVAMLGRWDWEEAEETETRTIYGQLPDLGDNDPFRESRQ